MWDCYLTQSRRRPKLHRVQTLGTILLTLAGVWTFRGINVEPEENHPWTSAEEDLARLEQEMREEKDDAEKESAKGAAAAADKIKEEGAAKKKKAKSLTSTRFKISLDSLNPMSLVLGPLQKILKTVCLQLRTANNLFSWKDPFLSFWASLAAFFIWIIVTVFPYAFFFFWVFRIVSFALFGPQNIFVGVYLENQKKDEHALNKSTKVSGLSHLRTRGGEIS